MRYTLLKAVFISKPSSNGKVSTPIVGYVLEDTLDNSTHFVSRKEAYNKVTKYKSTNVEAYKRKTICKEDIPDEEGYVYYLKLINGSKIKDFFVPLSEYKKEQLEFWKKLRFSSFCRMKLV